MKTILDAAIPAFFGSAFALSIIHICRAIWGVPKTLFKGMRFDHISTPCFQEYYRTGRSWLPTFLMILGFVLGSGTAAYFRPILDAHGIGWCSSIIAGLVVGICILITLRMEDKAIRAFISCSTAKNKKSEQGGDGDAEEAV
jgi:uncharacterized membrane-anchored protein